jgi:MFS family permease
MRSANAPAPYNVLRWLFIIQLASMGAMEMSGPFWPLHLRTLGQLSASELAWASGIAYAGPMLMAICFTPFWGRLGDRVGHKPMLLRALLALAGTQLWVAYANDVVMVLAARVVQGALAGFIAAAQAYGACLVGAKERGALLARLQIATAIGSVMGPFIGGLVFDTLGFRTLNVAAAVLCFGSAAVAWLILPETRSHAPRAPAMSTPPRSFSLGAIYGLLVAIVLVQTGKMMPQAFFGLYAEEVLRIPAWLTGLCYGATALGICIGAPIWAKRFEQRSQASVLREVQWICLGCALVVAVQGAVSDMTIVILARIGWGVLMAALLPIFYGLLSRGTPEHAQGQVLGAGNSAAKVGALAGTALGAAVLVWLPISYAFWPVAAMYLVSALALSILANFRLNAVEPELAEEGALHD